MTTQIFHKILCPVDFGDSSLQGLRYAGAAAQCQDARLIVFHACQFSPPPYFTKSQIDELARQCRNSEAAARERLEELISATLESRAGEVELRLVEAPAVEGILKTAEELQCDLVVIGAHHKQFLDTTILGTTTERVVRHGPCPVLVVPNEGND